MLDAGTFSIAACDIRSGEFGVAVQSRFFAVGAAVPHARAGAGAVAIQAWFDPAHGPLALKALEGGAPAQVVLASLLSGDGAATRRQIGIVDAAGRVAVHTGAHCAGWAGHISGEGFCCQGNMLAGPSVLEAMATTFRTVTGPLPERMLAALAAGQAADDDRPGKRSAALYVARPSSGYAWQGDRYIDLRADDHPEPVRELGRLLRVYRAGVWGRLMEPVAVLDAELIGSVQALLRGMGRLSGESPGRWDEPTVAALQRFCADTGLEEPYPLYGVTLPRALLQALLDHWATRDD